MLPPNIIERCNTIKDYVYAHCTISGVYTEYSKYIQAVAAVSLRCVDIIRGVKSCELDQWEASVAGARC